MKRSAAIIHFSLCLTLAGCQSAKIGVPVAAAPPLFYLSASVTLSTADDKKRLNINWKRRQAATPKTFSDEVTIRSSVGHTLGRAQISQEQATLEWKGKVHTEESAATLAKKIFGYPMPIDSFGHWIIGESSPLHSAREIISFQGGPVKEIHQQDWQIEYLEWDSDWRPKKINLSSAHGEIDITIKRWIHP